MNLGDVNVKKFGKEGDYLIKIENASISNIHNVKKHYYLIF